MPGLTKVLSPEVRVKFWFFSRVAAAAMLLHVFVVGPLFGAYARSKIGSDDLCMASYYGDTGRIRLLLNAGADPNSTGWEEHYTPLGEAVRSGQVESAHLLLLSGADPNAPNDRGFGKTASATASATERDDDGDRTASRERVIELIRNAGGR